MRRTWASTKPAGASIISWDRYSAVLHAYWVPSHPAPGINRGKYAVPDSPCSGPNLTAIWVRERRSGGLAEVVHCHLLFHLAHPFLAAGGRLQVEGALERLIDRHGRGNFADHTLKLTFPRNPNGLYLLKGGGPDVWQAFGVPMSWRKRQGLIVGKRCGTTQNIGPAARQRWRNRLRQVKQAAA